MRRGWLKSLGLLSLLVAVGACDDERRPPGEEACAAREPLRRALFGDLHAHSALSWDAYGYQVRTSFAEALAFARGEPVWLPPLDDAGRGTRRVQLERPLDFVAVTDHAEFLGETRLCATPGSGAYDTALCRDLRAGGDASVSALGIRLASLAPFRPLEICNAADCEQALEEVWREMQAAVRAADDRTAACTFTAFLGYEYTASPQVTNLHRNVIFASDDVLPRPISYFEQPSVAGLWTDLARECLDAGTGCDALLVPHNGNWSNGRLYTPLYPEGASLAEQRALAALRLRLEPVAEIFQHKGDGECQNGFAAISEVDPLCDFEKLHPPGFDDCGEGTGAGGVISEGCVSRFDFLRQVFKEGLREERRLGVNPYRFAVIGSTDTHNGTPGLTDDVGFPGHVGLADDTAEKRLGPRTQTHDPRAYNPGGLAGVWAEENSRAAIVAALRRGESFATSGARIAPRLFAAWDLPADLCARADRIAVADQAGVPIGGQLGAAPAGGAPVFLVLAEADAGSAARPGVPLQRLELIKGWLDAGGETHEQVIAVAGDPDNGASVDPATCVTSGVGARELCAVWRDPAFDPTAPSFYYLRAVENPSCRAAAWDCLALAGPAQPAACTDGSVALVQQGRAWTSPIWFSP